MARYRLLIFDFDGTLVDTAPDIAACVNAVFAERGFPKQGLENVKTAVGLGVHELVRRLLGPIDPAILEALVRSFRERYAKHLVDRSRPFPGVVRALEGPLGSLRKAVVTNKPHALAIEILDRLGLARFFSHVIGTGADFPPKPDPSAVRHILRETETAEGEAVLIGDSSIDLETARNASVDFGWVAWGYERVENMPPEWSFASASEWARLGDST